MFHHHLFISFKQNAFRILTASSFVYSTNIHLTLPLLFNLFHDVDYEPLYMLMIRLTGKDKAQIKNQTKVKTYITG